MKIRCPRCSQKLTVADEWAGMAIRCPACNKGIQVPRPQRARDAASDDGMDLQTLATLEASSHELDARELAQAEQTVHTAEDEDPGNERVCPHCHKRVRIKDPFVDVLCSECWQTIPALKRGQASTNLPLDMMFGRARVTGANQFYAGLGDVFTYPFRATGSLFTAIVAAVASILIPVALATGLARTMEQSQVGTGQIERGELTGIQAGLMIFLGFQVLFFLLVGLHALVEAARATSVGTENAPDLVWNPTQWGESIFGLLAVLAVNGVAVSGTAWLTLRHAAPSLASLRELPPSQWNQPLLVIVVLGLALVFPMNLIALACGRLAHALNPVRIVKSILETHLHYVFLFLLFLLLSVFFASLAGVVVNWFAAELVKLQQAAVAGNLIAVAGGLLSWGLVMGVGFYSAYLFGRVLGLFARAFEPRLHFGG